jgi:hypothetical protein
MSMRNALASAGVVGFALLALGCSKSTGSSGSSGGTTAAPSASAATTATAAAQPGGSASAPSAPSTAATATTTATGPGSSKSPIDAHAALYPLADIKPIADDCAAPAVILATAPASVGDEYRWQVSRQAFLANQQFSIVSRQPTAHGEVRLSPYHYNASGTAAYALVATCGDGTTCNQVAAMNKALVRSSRPQLVCGTPTGITGDPLSFSWGADPKDNLPAPGDAEAQCARLSACTLTTYRPVAPGDLLLDCQKSPIQFGIGCASRYPCSDVLDCAMDAAVKRLAAGAGGGEAAPAATATKLGDACKNDADCANVSAMAVFCEHGHCDLSCIGANFCASGYRCIPVGGAHGQCFVDTTPPDLTKIGTPCDLDGDHSSLCRELGAMGDCDRSTDSGMGHCTVICKTDSDCPSGLHCSYSPNVLVNAPLGVCRSK